MKIWLNGSLHDESEARVSVLDHGFLYGDGVYETVRVRQGRPLFLADHLVRLKNSCRVIHLDLPWTATAIAQAVDKTLSANQCDESALRLQVSRGPGPVGFDIRACKTPTLVIVERPISGAPSSFYERGVVAAIVKTRRNHPQALPPEAKSTNCLNGILAKWESNRQGAFEGILLNLAGHVTEGTVSNIFAVQKGRLVTPSLRCGLLPGITRAILLRLARTSGIAIREMELTVGEMLRSQEIFLTNSLIDVMPVTRLKIPAARIVGDGRVGPVTQLLMNLYRRKMDEFCAAVTAGRRTKRSR